MPNSLPTSHRTLFYKIFSRMRLRTWSSKQKMEYSRNKNLPRIFDKGCGLIVLFVIEKFLKSSTTNYPHGISAKRAAQIKMWMLMCGMYRKSPQSFNRIRYSFTLNFFEYLLAFHDMQYEYIYYTQHIMHTDDMQQQVLTRVGLKFFYDK